MRLTTPLCRFPTIPGSSKLGSLCIRSHPRHSPFLKLAEVEALVVAAEGAWLVEMVRMSITLALLVLILSVRTVVSLTELQDTLRLCFMMEGKIGIQSS